MERNEMERKERATSKKTRRLDTSYQVSNLLKELQRIVPRATQNLGLVPSASPADEQAASFLAAKLQEALQQLKAAQPGTAQYDNALTTLRNTLQIAGINPDDPNVVNALRNRLTELESSYSKSQKHAPLLARVQAVREAIDVTHTPPPPQEAPVVGRPKQLTLAELTLRNLYGNPEEFQDLIKNIPNNKLLERIPANQMHIVAESLNRVGANLDPKAIEKLASGSLSAEEKATYVRRLLTELLDRAQDPTSPIQRIAADVGDDVTISELARRITTQQIVHEPQSLAGKPINYWRALGSLIGAQATGTKEDIVTSVLRAAGLEGDQLASIKSQLLSETRTSTPKQKKAVTTTTAETPQAPPPTQPPTTTSTAHAETVQAPPPTQPPTTTSTAHAETVQAPPPAQPPATPSTAPAEYLPAVRRGPVENVMRIAAREPSVYYAYYPQSDLATRLQNVYESRLFPPQRPQLPPPPPAQPPATPSTAPAEYLPAVRHSPIENVMRIAAREPSVYYAYYPQSDLATRLQNVYESRLFPPQRPQLPPPPPQQAITNTAHQPQVENLLRLLSRHQPAIHYIYDPETAALAEQAIRYRLATAQSAESPSATPPPAQQVETQSSQATTQPAQSQAITESVRQKLLQQFQSDRDEFIKKVQKEVTEELTRFGRKLPGTIDPNYIGQVYDTFKQELAARGPNWTPPDIAEYVRLRLMDNQFSRGKFIPEITNEEFEAAKKLYYSQFRGVSPKLVPKFTRESFTKTVQSIMNISTTKEQAIKQAPILMAKAAVERGLVKQPTAVISTPAPEPEVTQTPQQTTTANLAESQQTQPHQMIREAAAASEPAPAGQAVKTPTQQAAEVPPQGQTAQAQPSPEQVLRSAAGQTTATQTAPVSEASPMRTLTQQEPWQAGVKGPSLQTQSFIEEIHGTKLPTTPGAGQPGSQLAAATDEVLLGTEKAGSNIAKSGLLKSAWQTIKSRPKTAGTIAALAAAALLWHLLSRSQQQQQQLPLPEPGPEPLPPLPTVDLEAYIRSLPQQTYAVPVFITPYQYAITGTEIR